MQIVELQSDFTLLDLIVLAFQCPMHSPLVGLLHFVGKEQNLDSDGHLRKISTIL